MNPLLKACVLCAFLAMSGPARATVVDQRFGADGLNYVIGQWSRHDQWAMETNLSLKYVLFDCALASAGSPGCDPSSSGRFKVYAKYVGVFDFYANTRESSPLIHRSSNPALHLRWECNGVGYSCWFDVGVEHRSTGQVVNVNARDTDPTSPTYGQLLTEIEYQRGNRRYFESLSRGANYLSLSAGSGFGDDGEYGVSGKIYERGQERSNITWGPLAAEGRTFADYDLIRIDLSKGISLPSRYLPKVILAAEYTVGRLGRETDSANLNLIAPFASLNGWEFPLLIRAHLGPMERLSDYTQRRKTLGIGVALAY